MYFKACVKVSSINYENYIFFEQILQNKKLAQKLLKLFENVLTLKLHRYNQTGVQILINMNNF